MASDVDYYEIVRKKLELGVMYAPKHKKMFELMKILWNDEEIKLLSEFPSADKTISLKELSKKTGRDRKELKEMLRKPLKKGTIGKFGAKYFLLPLAPGIFEQYFLRGIAGYDTKENLEKSAKIFRYLFKEFFPQLISEKNWKLFRPLLPVDAKEKLIEINESAEVNQEILTGDLVMDLIERYDVFTTVPCQCRLAGEYAGEPCKVASPELGCFLAGPVAEAALKSGRPRMNKEQAIKFLRETEKAGLVHSRSADTFDAGTLVICNCCSCHCGALMPSKIIRAFATEPSNYLPQFNKELCTKCDICKNKCPMGAIFHTFPNENDKSDEFMYLKEEFCIGCGVCAANCPNNAIKMVKFANKKFPKRNLIGNKTLLELVF